MASVPRSDQTGAPQTLPRHRALEPPMQTLADHVWEEPLSKRGWFAPVKASLFVASIVGFLATVGLGIAMPLTKGMPGHSYEFYLFLGTTVLTAVAVPTYAYLWAES
jgi:hypothetical protein